MRRHWRVVLVLAVILQGLALIRVGADLEGPPANPYTVRINAGSALPYVDDGGSVWLADRGFTGGSGLAVGGDVVGTGDDELFTTYRWGMTAYEFPVPCRGTYRVTYHAAETATLGPGQRVFDVTAEGATVLSRLDVAAAAGWGTALVRSFDVMVSDQSLRIGFVAVLEDPMVSALLVEQRTSCGTATATPTPPTTTPPTTTAPTTAPAPTTTVPRSGGSGGLLGLWWGSSGSSTATTTAVPTATSTTSSAPTSTTRPPSSSTTAAPAPTTTAAAPPAPGRFPDASTTGVPPGTVLTPAGTFSVWQDGAVIDRLDVSGCIHVRADNVRITRTRVRGSCPGGAIDTDYGAYSGIVIEDVELDGLRQQAGYALLGNSGFTCRRCHIHDGGSGIRMTSDVVVEDSYIHDMFGSGDSHNSAVGSNGGRNFVLRRNNIDCGAIPQCSGALVLYAQPSVDNALVEGNLLNGGGFCTYGGYDPANPSAGTGIRYVNNTFGSRWYPRCGYHGAAVWFNVRNPGNQWTGNVLADGTPLGPPGG